MWIGPNTAFFLCLFGIMGIYAECVWPGRLVPGLLGSAALLTGAYYVARNHPSGTGLALLAVAALLFLVELIWKTWFVSGAVATLVLCLASYRLYERPQRIFAAVAIPWCVVFGGMTAALTYSARRARENKWSDISDGQSRSGTS